MGDNEEKPLEDNALGFSDPSAAGGGVKRDEKYNTRYLVSSMVQDKRRSWLYLVGGVVALGVIVAVLSLASGGDKPAPQAPAAAAAEVKH